MVVGLGHGRIHSPAGPRTRPRIQIRACGELDLREIIVPAPYGDTSGTEGAVTRYDAALLNRAPDTSGFEYWVDALERGAITPGWLVAAFSESEEFMVLTGTR